MTSAVEGQMSEGMRRMLCAVEEGLDGVCAQRAADVRVAVLAAHQGAWRIAAALASGADLVQEEKGLGDLVCEVDREAETAIRQVLQTSPVSASDAILGEETPPDGPTQRMVDLMRDGKADESARLWIVDPLDGTACFLFHTDTGLVSTLVALCTGGPSWGVQVAVAAFGGRGDVWCAVKGCGVWYNGERVSRAIPNVPLGSAWIDVNHFANVEHESAHVARLRTRLRTPGGTAARLVTTMGPQSGLALHIIWGERKLSAVVHDNHSQHVKQGPWDTAAIQCILEECGAVVLDGITGQRYNTLKPSVVVIASSLTLAQQLVRIMSSQDITNEAQH